MVLNLETKNLHFVNKNRRRWNTNENGPKSIGGNYSKNIRYKINGFGFSVIGSWDYTLVDQIPQYLRKINEEINFFQSCSEWVFVFHSNRFLSIGFMCYFIIKKCTLYCVNPKVSKFMFFLRNILQIFN